MFKIIIYKGLPLHIHYEYEPAGMVFQSPDGSFVPGFDAESFITAIEHNNMDVTDLVLSLVPEHVILEYL